MPGAGVGIGRGKRLESGKHPENRSHFPKTLSFAAEALTRLPGPGHFCREEKQCRWGASVAMIARESPNVWALAVLWLRGFRCAKSFRCSSGARTFRKPQHLRICQKPGNIGFAILL